MPGVQPVFHFGLRVSFTPVSAVIGGQLVEHRALGANPGKRACGPAAAGSLKVAGVAHWDVPATAATTTGPKVGDEHALTVISNCIIPVTFTLAAAEGDPLIIGTVAGQVAPAGVTPDARSLIGRAYEAVAAGAVGLARITV